MYPCILHPAISHRCRTCVHNLSSLTLCASIVLQCTRYILVRFGWLPILSWLDLSCLLSTPHAFGRSVSVALPFKHFVGRSGRPHGDLHVSYVNIKGEKKQEYDFTNDYSIVSARVYGVFAVDAVCTSRSCLFACRPVCPGCIIVPTFSGVSLLLPLLLVLLLMPCHSRLLFVDGNYRYPMIFVHLVAKRDQATNYPPVYPQKESSMYMTDV